MEVGIPQSLSSLEKSFLPTSRLSLESNVLDVKLASDKDDEGEIMLLAMILLQLNGVSLPSSSTSSSLSSSSSSISEEENDLANKKKRQRTSPDQLAILEQIFTTDKMPNQQTRVQLADQLGMSSRRVQIWFQNKRAKVKRSSLKPDECPSPSSLGDLGDSSSSIPAPESPSSSSESPSPSPSSPISTSKVPDTTSIISAATLSSVVASLSKTPISLSTSIPSDTPLADTTKQLKAQQLQFSLKAPFVETQPMLTSY